MNTQSTIYKMVFGSIILLSMMLAPVWGRGQIIAWQFGNPESAGNETTYNATTNNADLNTSVLSRGVGVNPFTLARSFTSSGYTVSGNKTDAITNNKYMQFTISAKSGFEVSLSTLDVRLRRSSAGPTVYSWRYSINGTTFIDIGPDMVILSLTDGTDQAQINLSGISALQDVQSGTTITLRIYSWGATGSGTFSFGRFPSGITSNSLAIGGTVSVIGSTPAHLAITSINAGSSPSANTPFNIVVQSQDASNYPSDVTLNTDFALSLTTGNGILGGTLTGTIPAGFSTVTISGVNYNTAETGVSITAAVTSGDALTPGTSSPFTVLDAADHLAFVNVQPYGVINTGLYSFTVEARRPDNSVDANYPTTDILVAKATGPGNLTGITLKTLVAGVCTFYNLIFNAAGTYTLQASSGSLTSATTDNIEIYDLLTYRSKTSGAWNEKSTWEAGGGCCWFDALEIPTSTRDVLIRSGHSVNIPLYSTSEACKNLTIENGATLYANSSTGYCFVYVYGDILNDGTIGGATDVIGFDIEGPSCQLSGNGSFTAARIAKYTIYHPSTTFTINQNIKLLYSSYSIPAIRNAQFTSTVFNIILGSGKQLTVKNAPIDLTGCTLTLRDNASLLDNGTIVGSTASNITVERMITGNAESWHLLSSPVAAQAISGAFTPSGTYPDGSGYDFFAWDETTGTWVNRKNTIANPVGPGPRFDDAIVNNGLDFLDGKGYLVEYQASNPVMQFKGNLNTGAVSYTLTKSGTGIYAAYNLVGNYYSSAIDWKAVSGWTRTSLVDNGGGYDMSIWNDAEGNYGTFNSAGSSGTHGVTQFIPVGQGFMVKAASAGSFGMDNQVRVHDNQPFLKSTEEISNILRLKVSGNVNTYSDEIVIEFGHPDAIGGAEKMFSFYETAPSLYTVKSTGNFSVDFRGEAGTVVIPVSFNAGADGNYTITASQLESFTSSTTITLEDIMASKTQNLMQNPVYNFSAGKNDNEARFFLHFGGTFSLDDKEKGASVSIYSSGNSVYISNQKGVVLTGEVVVYNMMGQPVIHQLLSGNPLTKIDLGGTTGYYLIKVVTSDNIYSEKVFKNK